MPRDKEKKTIMNDIIHSIHTNVRPGLALSRLTIGLALCFATYVHAAPVGGNVTAGGASISAAAGNMKWTLSSRQKPLFFKL